VLTRAYPIIVKFQPLYRLLRHHPIVRIYSRNAYDWTRHAGGIGRKVSTFNRPAVRRAPAAAIF
jgi:hypothetical protein